MDGRRRSNTLDKAKEADKDTAPEQPSISLSLHDVDFLIGKAMSGVNADRVRIEQLISVINAQIEPVGEQA